MPNYCMTILSETVIELSLLLYLAINCLPYYMELLRTVKTLTSTPCSVCPFLPFAAISVLSFFSVASCGTDMHGPAGQCGHAISWPWNIQSSYKWYMNYRVYLLKSHTFLHVNVRTVKEITWLITAASWQQCKIHLQIILSSQLVGSFDSITYFCE